MKEKYIFFLNTLSFPFQLMKREWVVQERKVYKELWI